MSVCVWCIQSTINMVPLMFHTHTRSRTTIRSSNLGYSRHQWMRAHAYNVLFWLIRNNILYQNISIIFPPEWDEVGIDCSAKYDGQSFDYLAMLS